jgi:hypothetical protein
MRACGPRTEAGQVNGPVRFVLTVEFSGTGEPVEGLVRGAGQSAQAFSGWSELFSVLMRLMSEPDGPAGRTGP